MIHIISGDKHSCLTYINSLAGDVTEYSLTENVKTKPKKETKKKTKKTTQGETDTQEQLTPAQIFWQNLTIDYMTAGLFGNKKLLLKLADGVEIPAVETLSESDNHLIIWQDNISANDKKRLKQYPDITFNQYSGIKEQYVTADHYAIIKQRFPKLAENVVKYLGENLPWAKFGMESQLNIFPSPTFGMGTAKYLVPLASNVKSLTYAYFMGDMPTVFAQWEAFDREGTYQPEQILRDMISEFRKLSRIVIAGKKSHDTIAEILLYTSDKQYYRYINNELKSPPSLKEIAVRYAKLLEAIVHQNIYYLY